MLRSISVCTLLAGLLLAPCAQGQLFELAQREDLRNIDPATSNGRLGRELATALGGRLLLAAAPFKEDDLDPGSQDGSVYSFVVNPNGTLFLTQTLQPAERFQFGSTLDADGEWAAIGSSNAVHLFRHGATGWALAQTLDVDEDVPATAGIVVRNLRASLALSGDLLAVGDTSANVDAGAGVVSNAGAVVLFRRGGDAVWRHEATLAAAQPVGASGFGSKVAVDGDALLIGAPNDKVADIGVGGAYLFQRDGAHWSLRRTLRNPDPGEVAEFGWSVALQDGLAVVGCATCFVFAQGPSNTGSFFTYQRNLGGPDNWGLEGETVGSRADFIDNFSISLRLSGGLLLVGATGTSPNVATLLAREVNGGWRELALLESAETTNTEFGHAVALAPARAFVGASLWPNRSTSERWGAVYSWYSPSLAACGGRLDRVFCNGFEDSQ
jgi:hypothetical protein